MIQVCNLSELIFEEGFEEGFKQGFKQGFEQSVSKGKAVNLIKIINQYVDKYKVSLEDALDDLSVSEEEYLSAKNILNLSSTKIKA